jgi:hypothetical protein
MIIFIKLLLAHLLGDFALQPASWVADKEQKTYKSAYLYLHILIHGLLAWILSGISQFGIYAALLAIVHGIIDILKLTLQKPNTKRGWFIADQLLHLLVIVGIAVLWSGPDFSRYEIDQRFWIYAAAVVLLTSPASIIIKNVISVWTPEENGTKEADLQNAGKYIGILERLFVFFFIVTGHFEAIGFLLAAKSIFRFGDLTQAKDRKLTEYVLIGTLLSFAFAMLAGFLADWALLQLL